MEFFSEAFLVNPFKKKSKSHKKQVSIMEEQHSNIRENRTFEASEKRLTAQKRNHRFYREQKKLIIAAS